MAKQMKSSGVKWIGQIPYDWEICRIKNVASLFTGNSIKDDEKAAYEDAANARPYIATKDVDATLKTVNYENGMYIKKDDDTFKVAPAHSTLMCIEGGSAGKKKAQIEKDVSFVNKLCCFAPKFCVPAYLYYFLCNPGFEDEFARNISGLIGGVSVSVLQNFAMILPPESEQQRISEYLEAKCTRINAVIEQTQVSIEEYKKFRQTVITQAVMRGIYGCRQMKDSGAEWIGEIPEEWETFRVAALYEERKENGNDELPILTVSINTGVSDRELSDEESERVFVRSEDRSKYMRVYPGDLTYNMMRAWQGAFGAVRVDGMVSPAYVIVKPRREIDSRYMEALLRTQPAKEEMKRYSHGIADFRLRLYWDKFRTIKVCFPPIEEQRDS